MGTITDAQRQWLQSLGNFVSPRAAKVPSPRDAAEQHVARAGSPSGDAAPSLATTFDRSKPAVGDDDGRLSAEVEYAKLPSALREKLSQTFWAGLETQQRRTLVETYTRLKRYGVWDYIKRVTGEKEHPEKHVKLFGFEFETDGNSGGLTYEASDAEALVKKLKASGHFGEDGAFMGLMHPGQKSNREWANAPDDPRGAHISTGKGNQVDAHIDKQAPVGKPVDGKTTVDPRQAYKHGTQELIPEAMRKKFLDEHFHKEDEVRFFVAGSGLFTLHVDDKVYEILCETGDLIGVPDSTQHWFDMGPEPHFIAIRFFTEPDGWVGHFTGTGIAKKFPRYEPGQAD